MERWVHQGAMLGIVAFALLTVAATPLPEAATEPPEQGQDDVYVAYTYQQPDGNRIGKGWGALPYVEPLDVPLDGVPVWLLGAPLGDGSVWAAVLNDGRVRGFQVFERQVSPIELGLERLPPGMPPVLVVWNQVPAVLDVPSPEASVLTHPVVLPGAAGEVAFVDGNGDLVIRNSEAEITRLAVNALPDARLLLAGESGLLFLADPTDRYEHGALGDDLEGGSVKLVTLDPKPALQLEVVLPGDVVAEGIAPLWVDLSGDGVRDLILTLSSDEDGAQVVVLNEQGEPLAGAAPVGEGQRWRHVIAVDALGPHGELELVEVLTPHLGGIVQYHRWGDHRLESLAQLGEYGSHELGSRNLDQAAVADFDGDERKELLLPGQSARTLAAIRRTADSAEEVWSVAIGGVLQTNIALVSFPDGTLAAGVGHDGPGLRLWLPE